eukprot:927677-Rhodomonas_salina.1
MKVELASMAPHGSSTNFVASSIRSVASRSAGEGWLRVLVGSAANEVAVSSLSRHLRCHVWS